MSPDRPRLTTTLLVAAFALTMGCRSHLDPRLYGQGRSYEPRPCTGCADDVRVTFLGVSGFLIRRGDFSILTAPLFTNPSLDDVLFDRRIDSDESLIDAGLPDDWAADVSAILVGHSHYDHLMDVPNVARNKAPKARVYGTKTMTHLLANTGLDPDRLRAVEAFVDYRMCPGMPTCENDNQGQPGDWITLASDGAGRALRLRALCSRHAPQFARLGPLWQGCAHTDRPAPKKASEWIMGDTFAYLVDFLEAGRPVFRVYYQDSATEPTYGYVPEELIRERPVDLAILCGGAFQQVDGNPWGIIRNTQARWILVGHWESFFRPLSSTVTPLPAHDFGDLVRRLEVATGARAWEGKFWLPAPGMTFTFRP